MKNKKVIGGLLTGVVICCVMAVNVFVLPRVFAASPSESVVSVVDASSIIDTSTASKAITTETSVDTVTASISANEQKGLDDKAKQSEMNKHPDPNAISKETANEIAIKLAKDILGGDNFVCTSYYLAGTGPYNISSWSITVTKEVLSDNLQKACTVSLDAYTGKVYNGSYICECFAKAYGGGVFVTTSESNDIK